MTVEKLLSALEGLRETGHGRWMAQCPAHEDRRASLSVRELGDGTVLLHCFAGCVAADVIAAVGLEFGDLFPPREHFDDTKPYRPVRLSFDPLAALHALAHEALVVAVIVDGAAVDQDLRSRLDVAVARIIRALDAVAADRAAESARRTA